MQFLHRFANTVLPCAPGAAIVFPILILIRLHADLSGESAPKRRQSISKRAPVDIEEARALAQLGILGTFVLGAACAALAAISRSGSPAE